VRGPNTSNELSKASERDGSERWRREKEERDQLRRENEEIFNALLLRVRNKGISGYS
jgi:hypothetical protein